MRPQYLLVLIGTFILFLLSCDNELDIIEPSGELPVVYGLLDPSDTIQLIRVERAFIDPVTSALVLAKDPEVLFYDDNTLSLIHI